jgi:predicted murein hydrolase (TIGR00659 family)
MTNAVDTSIFFGGTVSILAYGAGMFLQKKTKLAVFNPLLISIIITILVLVITGTEYSSYIQGAQYLSYLLTPATVCLAIPLYEQLELLKHNWKAVTAGILSGVLTSLCCVFALAVLFKLEHKEYVTLLPKSITTAIGIGVSEKLGGYISLTAAAIIITGILGNIFAETLCRICRITHPVAKGIAIGTASHAVGTAKAMEMGEIEGAMSSLSIVVSGLFTVAGASVFAQFIK